MKLPSVTKDEVGVGDVMIGHHLLIIPALLLDKKLKPDEGSLLDFCTMTNALTLYNRLITLPATLPDDLKDLRLYKYLTKKKILYELNLPHKEIDDQERKRISYLMFGRNVSSKELIPSMEVEDVVNGTIYYNEYYKDRDELSLVNPELKLNGDVQRKRENFIAEVIESTKEGRRGIASSIHALSTALPSAKIIGKLFGFKEKREITEYYDMLKVHRLRTAEYWIKAGMLGITFLPDFMRIPIIAGYQGHLRHAIRYLIQNYFDTKVLAELAATDAMLSPIDIPIPDGASNFLSKYHSMHSIEESFDNMRQSFDEFKGKIVEWERQQKTANRFEKLQIIDEMRSTLIKSLEIKKISDVTEITASFADSLASETLTGQTTIPGSKPLIELAINYIQAHLAKKRIWYFFTGHEEAAKMRNRRDLLKYAFGESLDQEQFDKFSQLTESLYRLSRKPMKHIKLQELRIPKIKERIVRKQHRSILDERLIKGEITPEQYDKILERLER